MAANNVIRVQFNARRSADTEKDPQPDPVEALLAPRSFSLYAQSELGSLIVEGEGTTLLVDYLRECLADREQFNAFIRQRAAAALQEELNCATKTAD